MPITRRTALQALAATGAATLLPGRARAREAGDAGGDAAILYDPTRCIGCRECVRGCAEANGCDASVAEQEDAELSPTALTVLERYEAGGCATFRKAQCMHCVDPACVSACMLGAMRKGEDGAVTWNADLCVGCRYCQIACPFNVPRFEWDSPTPELKKCELCPERRAAGLVPACVERCRRGALAYGTRDEMLAEAHRRIEAHPGRYNPKVYGEGDGGGTSVLYLAEAGVSFAEMGLPELGTESVPSLPERIQHAIYKGFLAPAALFGVLAAVVRRNTRGADGGKSAGEADSEPESGSARDVESADRAERSAPVGGRLFTLPFAGLLALFLVGLGAIIWRFAAGLGPTTNLSDGYPMGLWIAFDVVTGTALACGGYAVALLVYVANRGRYHPLVRAAIVTSALGYTLGGLSVLVDIGRAWNSYKIPLYFWDWNFNSILLEVALCIMAYTVVLWIEASPALLEKWRASGRGGLRSFAQAVSPKLKRAMPYIIALGLLLPTMHQSSLGSLMLLAGEKLHPLWRTPLLPLLFLVSCVGMGYAAVTLESSISARVFKRPRETAMLRALATPVALVLLTYVALRAVDVWTRGQLGLVARMDGYSLLFLLEMALFVVPAVGLLARRRVAGIRFLSAVAVLVVLAGGLYRFSTYLIAFDPGPEWSYFPAPAEFAVTVGLISAEVLGYLVLVKRFPILRGATQIEAPDAADEQDRGARGGARRPVAVGTAAVLAFLLVGAAGVTAQETRVDLRCLTSRQEHCLDEPVPVDEPHEANCATCHDLWQHATPADARQSCAGTGCHTQPEALSSFHRGLHAGVLENCVSCHPPHDARIPGGSTNCLHCHDSGGAPAAADPTPGRAARNTPIHSVTRRVEFRHSTHAELACTACHAAGEEHQSFEVSGLGDCRSCHHRAPLAADCLACHSDDDARRITREVIRTLDIRLASLDRPRRILPFDHAPHDGIDCRTCHTEGLALSAASTDCTRCHAEHHRATVDCLQCHARPSPGAHSRQVHLGCGGAGCHEQAPENIQRVPRTRELCLACHPDMVYHKPDRACATCHLLPPPRGGGR